MACALLIYTQTSKVKKVIYQSTLHVGTTSLPIGMHAKVWLSTAHDHSDQSTGSKEYVYVGCMFESQSHHPRTLGTPDA